MRDRSIPDSVIDRDAGDEDDPEYVPGLGDRDTTSRCCVPPPGWKCTQTPGHDGPCAAWPLPQADGDSRPLKD